MKYLKTITPNLRLATLLVLVLSFQACTIEQHIHFKEDFSGKLSQKIDLSGLKMMGEMFKQNNEDTEDESAQFTPYGDMSELDKNLGQAVDSLKEMFAQKGIDGINNLQLKSDKEGLIELVYDFENLQALNGMYTGLKTDGIMPSFLANETRTVPEQPNNKLSFQRKGKKLIFELPSIRQGGLDNDPMQEDLGSNPMGSMMTNMFKTKTTISFERPIAKVKVKNLDESMSVRQQERSYTIESDLTNPPKQPVIITFKLK
ncbi:hypothetical protein [Eisenibacter elegans]|jgi:hypothetical protein|uniref:hypothetical protein n=1 Tax=Eisenibacter elegans TaxID=997 RepID=UPI0004233E58|nr:hypothetical protein [Eisenibacter elegans]